MRTEKIENFVAVAAIFVLAFTLVMYATSSDQIQLPQDAPSCGLTHDFYYFLEYNGYGSYAFNRTDLPCGSYGGRTNSSNSSNSSNLIPVIFIHDNQDVAYGRGGMDGKAFSYSGLKPWQTGFRGIASFLMQQHNYTSAQLYTTTYGYADEASANNNYHNKNFLVRLRKFVEAVLVYTGAKQVNIISHGMGVTIARKVVKGGYGQDHQSGYYDLGASLQKYVKSFIGIAGYNMGLISCAAGGVTPFCGKIDGFFPGNIAGTGLSEYLADLNLHGGAEGTNVWTAWSQDDEKIGPGSIVYNKITCRIPGQNGEIKKTTSEWTHYYIRDNIGRDILPLL